VTLSFTLWIPTTVGSTNHFGGFGVHLHDTVFDDNSPFVFFTDAGQVVVFTNKPSQSPLELPYVPIASWSNLAGTVMTNVLVVNYPAGTFSFSLNGAVLTNNMAIPGVFTNYFEVHLNAEENTTNAGVASLGNTFAVGNVLLTVSSSQPLITSITRTNSGVVGNNDILIKWNTNGTTNNHVQVTTGMANGSFSTNAFANLANIAVTTTTTNYLDVGGATNTTTGARYYRISSP